MRLIAIQDEDHSTLLSHYSVSLENDSPFFSLTPTTYIHRTPKS